MRILLLRHGEPRRGGDEDPRADYGLTEVGQRQINTVAENMTDRIDRLVASHLPRAQESADIVARHLGIARVVTEPMIPSRNGAIQRISGSWCASMSMATEEKSDPLI